MRTIDPESLKLAKDNLPDNAPANQIEELAQIIQDATADAQLLYEADRAQYIQDAIDEYVGGLEG